LGGEWVFLKIKLLGVWVWIGVRSPLPKKNGTLGLDWGTEGKGFHGSIIGVRVLELDNKNHLGFILFFQMPNHDICLNTYVFLNLVHFICDCEGNILKQIRLFTPQVAISIVYLTCQNEVSNDFFGYLGFAT
jgi:hypothetical protein